MKLASIIYMTLFSFFLIGEKSFAISNYQIKKICKKEKSESNCIKNLREKRDKLQKGFLIEIPVIPSKK